MLAAGVCQWLVNHDGRTSHMPDVPSFSGKRAKSVSNGKKELRLAIAGLGTVGAGVVSLLQENAELLAARAGRVIRIVAVSARDRKRDRGVKLEGFTWYDDPVSLATAPDIDVVLELIGGAEDAARALVEASLTHGRDVVTANKALIAIHGAQLSHLAATHDAALLFEASVAGGIPAIKLVREGLAADQMEEIGGILNGTCNYILTKMGDSGEDFSEVLASAQKLGYAETDPSTDVDGWDAAHKLAILAGLAFGQPVSFSSIRVEGIRHVASYDHQFAREMGYRIKLLGMARRLDKSGAIEASMRPCMVPRHAPIANINGVFNAVRTQGRFSGPMLIEGRGAGAGPTASAVMADVMDLARGTALPVWGTAPQPERACAPISALSGAYYLRLLVRDKPGVMAGIASALRDEHVSMRAMSQHNFVTHDSDAPLSASAPEPVAPLAIITHQTQESAMKNVVARLSDMHEVLNDTVLMKIES